MFKNKNLYKLRIASCMAPNADETCLGITRYVQEQLGLSAEFAGEMSWRERERQFDNGDIHLCWLCGLPYVWKADAPAPEIELVAAPVMMDVRYGRQPVYYSDIVVHKNSRHLSFQDLRGASWAYNEPNSHSGYNVVRHHLSTLNEHDGYFRAAVESGAHQQSLKMILSGDVDASAIDSTVLEAEMARTPALREQIRVIGTLGPSPMPPWVMRRTLPDAVRQALRDTFLGMGSTPQGQAILRGWGIAGFVEVDDTAYDPIRQMSRECERVRLAA